MAIIEIRNIGKLQIVIGLLTGSDGYPISIEVFKGNTGWIFR